MSIRSYSLFVGISKVGLLIAVVMLVAAIVVVGAFKNDDSGARLVLTSMSSHDDSSPAMMNPRYQGVDQRNRPFTVTATQAMQMDADRVRLNDITADLTMETGNWVAMTAGEDVYDSVRKLLDLTRGVTMYYEGGLEMRSTQAMVNLGSGEIEGTLPIEGQGMLGELHAKRWRVLERGQKLQFFDSVKVRLYPKEKKK